MRRLGLNELLTSNHIAGPSEGKAVSQDTRPNPVISQRFPRLESGYPCFSGLAKGSVTVAAVAFNQAACLMRVLRFAAQQAPLQLCCGLVIGLSLGR